MRAYSTDVQRGVSESLSLLEGIVEMNPAAEIHAQFLSQNLCGGPG